MCAVVHLFASEFAVQSVCGRADIVIVLERADRCLFFSDAHQFAGRSNAVRSCFVMLTTADQLRLVKLPHVLLRECCDALQAFLV